MPRDYTLRVTRRALEDIGMKSRAGAAFDLDADKQRHPILEAFLDKRGRSPVGQEQTLGIKAPVYNLHARNPWRGVTWYDEDAGVCWLLGVTAHQYDLFVERAKVGGLTPTESDYADLELARSVVPPAADEGDVVAAIRSDGAALVAEAFAKPNTEVAGVLAESLDVALFAQVIFTITDGADLFIGFRMPPRPGATLPDQFVEVCVAVMLPDADPADIDWRVQEFPGRAFEPGGWVVRWRRPAH